MRITTARSTDVALGSHEFQTRVQLNADTIVTTVSNARLEFDNDLLLNGQTLTKSGLGAMFINNALTADGGAVNCNQGICGGVGTIGGDLNNNGGTISPGGSSSAASVVPEPGSVVLLVLGGIVFLGCRSRRFP